MRSKYGQVAFVSRYSHKNHFWKSLCRMLLCPSRKKRHFRLIPIIFENHAGIPKLPCSPTHLFVPCFPPSNVAVNTGVSGLGLAKEGGIIFHSPAEPFPSNYRNRLGQNGVILLPPHPVPAAMYQLAGAKLPQRDGIRAENASRHLIIPPARAPKWA